ncbi:Nidogen-1 [Dirofilaria immitis]|nr:Nidogen-1 [Dirofilaria immitis]
MLFLLLPYWITLLATHSLGAEIYGFGFEQGDQVLSLSNDSYAVTLDIPIIYFEENQNELFIYSRGIVTFGKVIDVTEATDLDREKINAIAIFLLQSVLEKFFIATSSDTNLLYDLTDKIRKNFPNRESSDFTALHAIVITWSDMVGEDSEQGSNQFQMILVTDGMSSYVFLIYNRINWTEWNNQHAQAGLYFSDGRRETMINSGTASIKELVNLSNNQNEGTYIFRISGAAPEDPRGTMIEDDYNYNDYEQEYDSDNDRKRQHKPLSEDCPTDPYHDQCPVECQVLTDNRGCSLCVCAQPPQPNKVEENVNEVNKIIVPSEREEISVKQEESISKDALEEQNIRSKQSKADDENEGGLIHDVEGITLSCAAASEKVQPCSSHAKCIDYDPGYCCECLSGYYGNGEECLKNGEPQRINGGFEGVVNGKEMDRTELHTYVMVEEGRSYTALSQIPPELGRSLLLLNAIGGAMGWLFAKVMSATSYNGFMLTGGLFNRTVNVHIGDRYMVTIKQQFSGRDIYHYFKAHMFISGTLLKLAEDTEIIYSDHDEEYRREGPGFLRSYSSQMIIVKENGMETQMKLSTDQQIHYKECPFREFTKDSVVVIHATRIHVVYDVEEHIVRYASANVATNQDNDVIIGPSNTYDNQLFNTNQQLEQQQQHYRNQQSQQQNENVENQRPSCTNCLQNACESGRHLCKSPNMICIAVGRSYRCECVKGYQAEYDNDADLGWKCIDVNECERGEYKCDHNAICVNLEGTFKCQCGVGYEGDGYLCRKVGTDDEKRPMNASGCLDHQECHQWGECIFGKDGKPGYCKCRGWYTGDGVHHCGPPTETEIKQIIIEDSQPRQICAGYKCDENAYCDSLSGHEQCICRNGYDGNGISCSIHVTDVTDRRKPNVSGSIDDGISKVCTSHGECGIHGNCVYNNDFGVYSCVCVPPYFNSSNEFREGMPCNVVNNCNTNADCIFEKTTVMKAYIVVAVVQDSQETADFVDAMLGCDQLGNCDLNAVCVLDAYTNRHYCRCLDGFDGDGYTCEIVRQHTLLPSLLPDSKVCREASDCNQNAHCVVRENSSDYFCECLPGYRGDGVTRCTIADDCTPGNKQACHENADCVFEEAEKTYTCKCMEGFVGNGRQCIERHATTCDEQPGICHHSARCIYSKKEERYKCVCKDGTVGDGHADCHKEVELHHCSECSSHARCVHVEADDSWRCRCMQGYVGNGHLCTLYTSCLDDRSLCAEHAECVPNEYGHYVCNCHYGYHGNGRTCTPDSESRDEAIFICRGMTIIQKSTNPDLPGKQLIIVPHQIAVGIDFDCQEERIIWSDIAGHSILSASINGTDEQKFMDSVLKSPEGVAVDWSSRNVYYADSVKDEIGVLSLDGKYYKTLINEGLVNPRALAIDLTDRYLYYSDWHRENPLIGRVRLDGTENSAFITADVHLPNGLTVLLERRQLCWVDAGLQQLSCIGLNGNNRRIVYAPLQYPFGLTVHNEQRFYWTDWSDNKIHSVSVNGDGYISFPATVGGSGRLYGLVSVPLRCKGVATACAVNNGGCEYLCLPGRQM